MVPETNLQSQNENHPQGVVCCPTQNEQKNCLQSYLFSIINFQNYLSCQLLQSQSLISSYFAQKIKQQDDSSHLINYAKQLEEHHEKLRFYDFQNFLSPQIKIQASQEVSEQSSKLLKKKNLNRKEKKIKKVKYSKDDSDYDPDKQGSGSQKNCKVSQSKNVPKNFSKAVLIFIKKSEKLTKKLLEQYGLDYQQFVNMTMEMKGKINSIAELRSLWIQSENKFGKMFRIMTSLYVRRHSLGHIFNSRVQNYSMHLKYRQKIIQAIRNPSQFTQMKDY